ncbi:MAG TPA: chemotaxis response regulator protein-glutamate methylesterase [Tepidisphaeraceae bacterium]|nr:chemotaxis response regulator protein-glutamate methylesterase [Tepidisphaeraceae bacterium]
MRIAIVNDLLMAVEAVRRVILKTAEHKVAWVARDGAEAVALCAADTPDLILMDLIMPRMDGVEATRRIMAATPCAIVVVTVSVTANSAKVFEAMGAGALDAVNTPALEHPAAADDAQGLLAKIETIRKLLGIGAAPRLMAAPAHPLHAPPLPQDCLVGLGSSAGGPAALATILAQLPEDFPAPLVIIQHVDPHFAAGLADWLSSQSALPVRLAREGDRPTPGTVLLAGRDQHLVFASPSRLAYTRHPEDCSYRPSVDAFFKSADRLWRGEIIGVLLTGMGRDGAEGLRDLHNHGHYTIAQDQPTCAVYGMPRAAAELNAASEILALDKIGPRLRNTVARHLRCHG